MSKKEVRGHIISIITVSLFLIIMTTFVYLPKQQTLLSSFAFLEKAQSFYMKELTSGILMHDANPTKDENAKNNTPYTFQVVNNSDKDITYQILFKNNEEKAKAKGMEVLPSRYLRYSLMSNNSNIVEPSTLSEDGVLYETTIKANSTETYDFRMWLSYYADNGAMNKIFIGKVEIVEVEK